MSQERFENAESVRQASRSVSAPRYPGLAPRKLGSCGLVVAPLGVGCWAIGGEETNLGLPMGWSTASESRSVQGLFRAFELGARLFDTADVYGLGRSERLLGRLLREVPRDDVVVVSKVGYFAGTALNAYQPLHMRHQLEQTLDNLGTDHLDVYSLHNFEFGPDDAYLDGAIEQMRTFRREGLIRAIGMRGPHRFTLDRVRVPKGDRYDKQLRFRRVFDAVRPDLLAVRYNALTPDGPDNVFDWASDRGVGILINKPLSQGLLTGKYDAERPPAFGPGDHRIRKRWFTPEALAVLRDGLLPVHKRFGERPADLVRVALRYCLQRADNAAVVAGFTGPEQVEMNFSCLGEPLTEDELTFVRAKMGALREQLDAIGHVFLDERST